MPVSRVTRTPILYQLRVALRGQPARDWRRVEVQGTMALPRLHATLQALMGWLDYHLHVFAIEGVAYGDPELLEDLAHEDYALVRLRDVAPRVGVRLAYNYDFGQ